MILRLLNGLGRSYESKNPYERSSSPDRGIGTLPGQDIEQQTFRRSVQVVPTVLSLFVHFLGGKLFHKTLPSLAGICCQGFFESSEVRSSASSDGHRSHG